MKNLLNKVVKIRSKVSSANLKKSGKNKHSGFQYYELSDFLPTVVKLEESFKLVSVFDNLNDDEATLVIYDLESDDKLVLKTKIADVVVTGMIDIQRLGSQHTYIKRYLYYNYLNLTENDTVDSLDQKTVTQQAVQPKPQVTSTTQPKPQVTSTTQVTPPIQPKPQQDVKLTDSDIVKELVKVKTLEDLNELWSKAQGVELNEATKRVLDVKAKGFKAVLKENKWVVE